MSLFKKPNDLTSKPKGPVAKINWSLDVDCPQCHACNDIAAAHRDPDNIVGQLVFAGKWNELSGLHVTCDNCFHDFHVGSVEY